MGFEHNVGRRLPSEVGNGFVRSENDPCPGFLSQASGSSVLKLNRSLSQEGSILANSSTSRRPLAGSLTKFIAPRSIPANEALQAGVRRIAANNMEDRIIGDCPAEVARVGPEPVQDFRMAELQVHNVNEVLCSDLSQKGKFSATLARANARSAVFIGRESRLRVASSRGEGRRGRGR